ncbi:MAG: YraN family protein [Patescibacteria group bacterium]
MNKAETGKLGENIACRYLVENKYKIIERNFRKPWGELDIIAKAPDKTLVFVEVKTMKENFGGLKPEDQLTKSKLQKLQRTASLYAGHKPELIDDNKGWRIDLIAITIKVNSQPTELLTINDKSYVIKQYENIA